MSNRNCPRCGELNKADAFLCTACGARLDGLAKIQPPSQGNLLKENISNILCLLVGVVFLYLGIFAPMVGSAIIQFILSFTENTHRSSSQPSDANGWWVIGFACLCFLFGGIGLYQSLKKFWTNRLDKSEPQD